MFFLILFLGRAQEIHQKTLSNNIDVYVQHIQSQKMLNIRIDYDLFPVAQSHEGLAHLTEHLMFHSAQNMQGKTFDQWIESFGGYSKAYTNLDTLSLTTQIPLEAWEQTLFLERDRMFHLCADSGLPSLTEEVKVVTQEFLSEQLIIDKRIDEVLRRIVFGNSTMGLSVLGDMIDLTFMTEQQVCTYIEEKLHSAPVRIIVSGDIDPERAILDLTQYFSQSRPQFSETEIEPYPVPQNKRYWYASEQKALYLLWPTVAVDHPQSELFSLIKTLLLSREVSWLKHERYRVQIWSEQTRRDGYWMMRIEGGDAREMYAFVEQRFRQIQAFWGGVDKRDLARTRLVQRRLLLHYTHAFASQTSFIAQCLKQGLSSFCLDEKISAHQRIQVGDIKKVFQSTLSIDNAYILSLGPSLEEALPQSFSLKQ